MVLLENLVSPRFTLELQHRDENFQHLFSGLLWDHILRIVGENPQGDLLFKIQQRVKFCDDKSCDFHEKSLDFDIPLWVDCILALIVKWVLSRICLYDEFGDL